MQSVTAILLAFLMLLSGTGTKQSDSAAALSQFLGQVLQVGAVLNGEPETGVVSTKSATSLYSSPSKDGRIVARLAKSEEVEFLRSEVIPMWSGLMSVPSPGI